MVLIKEDETDDLIAAVERVNDEMGYQHTNWRIKEIWGGEDHIVECTACAQSYDSGRDLKNNGKYCTG